MRERIAALALCGLGAVGRCKRTAIVALAMAGGALVFAAPADIARGVAWLQSQVRADGSLLGQPSDGAHQQARCETAAALIKLAGNSAQVASVLAALDAPDRATETLACWQQLRQKLGQTSSGTELQARRVSAQGYAPYDAFHISSALDTGWALGAQLQDLSPADKSSLLAWLQSNQSASGSFGVAGRADLLATAVVLRGMESEASKGAVAATVAAKAAAWLIAQRGGQGNWLGDVAITALVFEAVHPYSGVDPTIASAVDAFLLGQQRPDGSWQGDAYVTAVALRALALTGVEPVDPTLAGLATIRGNATSSSDGKPLGGVSINVQPTTGTAKSAATNSQGQYLLQGIAPGSLAVTASLAGYQTVSGQVTVEAGGVVVFSPGMFPLGSSIPATGVIKGKVFAFGSNVPLASVSVGSAADGQLVATTDAQGGFEIVAQAGTYALAYSLAGYVTQSQQVVLSGGSIADVGAVLLKSVRTTSTLRGSVTDLQGAPVVGATVLVQGTAGMTTNSAGAYAIDGLVGNQISGTVSAPGYVSRSFTVNTSVPADLVQDVALPSTGAAILTLSQTSVNPPSTGLRQDITATASVTNSSGELAAAGVLAFVNDFDGNRVATLAGYNAQGQPLSQVALRPGQELSVFFKWNTETFSPGTYTVTTRLQVPGTSTKENPDGIAVASSQARFQVAPGASFLGSITANPPVLRAGTSTVVKLFATLQNDGNVVLPAQSYTLSVIDTKTAQAVHAQSLSSEPIAKSQLRSLTFNDWTPQGGGNFRVELTSPTTPSALLTTTLYVGDSGLATFTVDKSYVPAGTQRVRGSVRVTGQDATTGIISDPLEPMIRAALAKAVNYADKKAFDHTTNDLRCYACHVQTQALVGGERNLKFTQPVDALRRPMLVSQITQNIDTRGAINNSVIGPVGLSTVWTSTANSSLALWGLTPWHDPVAVAGTRVKIAGYLSTAQRNDGSWLSENGDGWWRTPAPMTAINAQSFVALKTYLQANAAPRNRAFNAYRPQGLSLNAGAEVRVNADTDGTLYLASWTQGQVWKVSNGIVTPIISGKIWNARPLGDGRLLLAGDDGVRIREANGTIRTLNPINTFDAKPWGDKFLVSAGNTVYRMDSSGALVPFISDPVLEDSATEVVPHADGTFLVASYYGRKVARFSASGQYIDTPVLLSENGDWGLWLVPFGTGHLVGSEKGLIYYNKDWVAERWSHTRTVSAASRPDGSVIAYMGGWWDGGLHEITDGGSIDVTGTASALEASIGKAASWLRVPCTGCIDTNNNIDHAFRLMGLASVKKYYEGTSRAAEFDAAIQSVADTLRSRQRADGGWVWKQGVHTTSDSMVTAMAGLALDTLNPSRDAPEVRKAIELLLGRQREDGSWLTENEVVTQWRTVNGVRTLDTNLVLVPSTWVEIWLPTMLDRVGRLDTDLSITFAPNVVMSNPDHTPTSVTPTADGSRTYVWKFTALPTAGDQVNFDVELKDMRVDETRPVAQAAGLVFRNTFVAGSVTLAIEVPKVSVGTSLGLIASTDKPSYGASDQAVFSARVDNPGTGARDAQVRFTVLDATAKVVDVLPLGARINVPASGSASISGHWPVAGVLAGTYQLRADLSSPAGLPYGSATANFAVSGVGDLTASARIGADRLSYDTSQTVLLVSRVANLTANAPQDDVRAVTTVRTAAGQEVFTRSESIAQLVAGTQLQYSYALVPSALGAGSYQASVRLMDSQGAVLSQAVTSFSVAGTEQSGVGLAGQLQAAPSPVSIGSPVAVRLDAANNGTTPLADVLITMRVLEPQSALVLGSFTQTVGAWPQGGSQALTWNWRAQGVDGQTVVAVASASIAGRDVPLGQAVIRIVGVPQLRAQPAQLNFAPLYVGENASQALIVQSVGTAAAGSITFTLAGTGASHYAIPQGGCTESASLPIGATCTLAISWRPQTAGSHVGEVRVSHANGEPVSVGVAGQARAVIFSGVVSADAPEVEAGRSVGLSYSVSNPARVTSTMAGSLQVAIPGGRTLRSWPVNVGVPGLATYAGSEPYATGAEAQTLTVALSQQVGSGTFVLATTTFTVVDPPVPLGVGTGLRGQSRILALVSCPPGLGTAEDAACQAQRAQAITNYLHALGLGAKVVTTRDAFLAEMRCGSYNTYWLSGGAIKLDEQIMGELREAVYRGEALWMDGVHDSRNQLLHPAAGVKEIGKLPDRNLPASSASQGLYGTATIPTLGQVGKFQLTTGEAQGLFTQVPGEQEPIPAIVSNDWGRGKSLLFAFDLAAMLAADATQADTQLRGLVIASASHAASASPTLTLGDMTQLTASIGNLGTRTVAFRAEATLPVDLVSIATSPAAQLTANTDGSVLAIWSFSLGGGAEQELTWLVRAQRTGSYSAPLAIYSLPAPGSNPKLRASTTLNAEVRDGQSLLDQVLPAARAIDPPASSDKNNRAKALDAVSQALALHGQGNYEAAIVQWLAAADALAAISSTGTTAARSAVALAMEASTDALCIQRCGTAACH